ncbi:MAG: Gfo/Idh/MocA family oxidoreductase [Clostridiales bacterium]|nr:Gfo/Idh/MocA family oxidoreductase [Clostridiales bacterium]
MNCAIIGCGRIAPIHADALRQTPIAKLIACADIHLHTAEAFAAQYAIKPYTDYKVMIQEIQPEVIHICTPHHLHVEMAEYALCRGIHVLMEKPAAISRAGFLTLINAEQISKARIGICFQNRYNASIQRLKELIENQEAGAVLGARCVLTWQRDVDYYSDDWHGKQATEGGGVLMNQAIHTMDLLVHLLGAPCEVQAAMHNRHLQGVIEVEDTLEAYIRFGQSPALFYASLAYCTDAPVLLEVVCEKATYQLQGEQLTIISAKGQPITTDYTVRLENGMSYWGTSHRLLIQDFYRALNEGTPFPITPSSIIDTMNLVYGCYDSARSGKPIELKDRMEPS